MNVTTKITEQTILGTVLYNPEALQRIGATIHSTDFYFPEHKKLWNIIQLLRVENKDVNILSVMNVLNQKEPSKEDEHLEYLEELVTQYHVDVDSALTLSTQMVEEAGLRNLKMELELFSSEVASGNKSFPELMNHMATLTTELSSKGFSATELFGQALANSFFEMLDAEKSDYKLSGINNIDNIIYDFNPGELIIVAARPGVGKTAFLLQSARVQLEAGRTVGFISLEMPEAKLLQRLVSATAGVDGNEIAAMSSEEFLQREELFNALQFYTQNEQLIIDTGAPYDIDTIERIIRKMKYVHKVDVVYIDYIQLIGGSNGEKGENRQQQISTISRRLKNLASELGIRPVIAAQLNRNAVQRETGPLLSDLRDSGALEQDASIIIFMYPYFPGNLSEEQKELALAAPVVNIKFQIAKQRNGPVKIFDLEFVKNIGIIRPKSGFDSYGGDMPN